MPKPQSYSITQVVDALHKGGGLLAGAAQILGCTRRTIEKYADRYPTVKDAMTEAQESITDLAESKLYAAIKSGEAWAICFYLKTRGKSRGYVERTEVEHSGHIGNAAEDLTDEELTAIINRRCSNGATKAPNSPKASD